MPESTDQFLFSCLKDRNSPQQFSKILTELLLNSSQSYLISDDKIANSILTTYYPYITTQDKQSLMQTLSSQFITSEYNNQRESRGKNILYLIHRQPDLEQAFIKNIPQIPNAQKDLYLQEGTLDILNLIQKYNIENSARLELALHVLKHEDIILENMLHKNPDIANEIIYYTVHFGIRSADAKPVSLAAYIFEYGDFPMIEYIINHNLIQPIDYNYDSYKYNTTSNKPTCKNYLYELWQNNKLSQRYYTEKEDKIPYYINNYLKNNKACSYDTIGFDK